MSLRIGFCMVTGLAADGGHAARASIDGLSTSCDVSVLDVSPSDIQFDAGSALLLVPDPMSGVEWVVLLDDRTCVAPDFCDALLATIEEQPEKSEFWVLPTLHRSFEASPFARHPDRIAIGEKPGAHDVACLVFRGQQVDVAEATFAPRLRMMMTLGSPVLPGYLGTASVAPTNPRRLESLTKALSDLSCMVPMAISGNKQFEKVEQDFLAHMRNLFRWKGRERLQSFPDAPPKLEGQNWVIGVATRERPQLLRRALRSIADLAVAPGISLTVVVVENEAPTGLAAELEGADWPFELSVVNEPEAGLSKARNRLLEFASDCGADWLCMIDDDEVCADTFILEYARAMANVPEARILAGPYRFTPTAPLSGWRRLPQQPTVAAHSMVRLAATGNIMLSKDVFHDGGLLFDESFDFTGGEDTDFSYQARKAGFEIYWVPHAIVEEDIGESRAGLRYSLTKEMRNQQNILRIVRKNFGLSYSIWFIFQSVTRAVVFGTLKAAIFPIAAFFRKDIAMRQVGDSLHWYVRLIGVARYVSGRHFFAYGIKNFD